MKDSEFGSAVQRQFEASQRLDYLLITIASGLLAYSVENYAPVGSLLVRVLVPSSWLLLVVSIWLGLKRLEIALNILGRDVTELHPEAKPGPLRRAVLEDWYTKKLRSFARYARYRNWGLLSAFVFLAVAQLMGRA